MVNCGINITKKGYVWRKQGFSTVHEHELTAFAQMEEAKTGRKWEKMEDENDFRNNPAYFAASCFEKSSNDITRTGGNSFWLSASNFLSPVI